MPADTPSGLPTLFLPHGAPDLVLRDIPARRFLTSLAAELPRTLRGIVVVSAHWEAALPSVTSRARPPTVHDFSGWGAELEAIRYPVRTDPALLDALHAAFAAAGMALHDDPVRGLDHGAWAPLRLVWPDAALPVVQLSLVRGWSAEQHVELGRILAPLVADGWLVVGSGATVHDLRSLAPEGTPVPGWAREFDAWLGDALGAPADRTALHPESSPHYRRAHPTPEHLLPLYVALGAAGEGARAVRLHESYSYGSVGMSAWRFDGLAPALHAARPPSSSTRKSTQTRTFGDRFRLVG